MLPLAPQVVFPLRVLQAARHLLNVCAQTSLDPERGFILGLSSLVQRLLQ